MPRAVSSQALVAEIRMAREHRTTLLTGGLLGRY